MPHLLTVCMAALLSGCATTEPEPPDVSATEDASFRQSADLAPQVEATWWQGFDDPVLAGLVQRAQTENHDVRIAAQRVQQARAGRTAVTSRLLPTVSLAGSASDERSGLPDPVKQGKPDTQALRGSLDLGWELDLFGAARSAAEGANLDALSAEEGVDAARWLVGSEVARQYLVWQSARLRLATLEALLKTQADTERLTRRREAEGLSSRFDVARAAGEVQSIAAQLPQLRTLVAVTETHLAVLMGANPNQPLPELSAASEPRLPTPPRLSPGQPVDLLLRRPDLRVAQKQLMAEAARLREAQADQWPKFFLAAALGRQDLKLNAMDLSPVRYSTAALAFSLPLFDAGRLRAAVEMQSAKQRVSSLQYEKAVLGAVKDVDDSLVALTQERMRLAALDAMSSHRQTGLRHAQSLHREGQIDLLQLLDAQRGVLAAELSLIDGQTQVALATVQLATALGGGWQASATPMPPSNTLPRNTPTRLAPESLP